MGKHLGLTCFRIHISQTGIKYINRVITYRMCHILRTLRQHLNLEDQLRFRGGPQQGLQ